MSEKELGSLNNSLIENENEHEQNLIKPGIKELARHTAFGTVMGATIFFVFGHILFSGLGNAFSGNSGGSESNINNDKFDFIDVTEYSLMSGAFIGGVIGGFVGYVEHKRASIRSEAETGSEEVALVAGVSVDLVE